LRRKIRQRGAIPDREKKTSPNEGHLKRIGRAGGTIGALVRKCAGGRECDKLARRKKKTREEGTEKKRVKKLSRAPA